MSNQGMRGMTIQQRAFNIDDLRALARQRLPWGLFDYVERGAEDDISLAANRAAFAQWQLLPHIGVDVSQIDLSCRWFGRARALPFAIGPTALSALMWFRGEEAMARAAVKSNIPYTTAALSLTAMETLRDISGDDLWFQLYLLRNRAATWQIVERAKNAGINTLVVTLDIPVEPNREYTQRSGFNLPFKFTARAIADVLAHPRWLSDVYLRYQLGGGLPTLANLPALAAGDLTDKKVAQNLTVDSSVTWATLRELREKWPHTLVLKGVLSARDAQSAIDCGADGIVISNHGGRALDGAVAPLTVLPEIVAAVKGRLTVLIDSGFRRGTDVVKALALGADGVLLGRAPLYGLAAGGEAGAAHALHLLQTETARALALLGCPRLAELDAGYLRSFTCV